MRKLIHINIINISDKVTAFCLTTLLDKQSTVVKTYKHADLTGLGDL